MVQDGFPERMQKYQGWLMILIGLAGLILAVHDGILLQRIALPGGRHAVTGSGAIFWGSVLSIAGFAAVCIGVREVNRQRSR